MIGGSAFLFEEVKKHLSEEGLTFTETFIGFPNAAVDRIVPAQSHDDPLFVVEGMEKTAAELSSEEKNTISHRAKALKKLKNEWQQWLEGNE